MKKRKVTKIYVRNDPLFDVSGHRISIWRLDKGGSSSVEREYYTDRYSRLLALSSYANREARYIAAAPHGWVASFE